MNDHFSSYFHTRVPSATVQSMQRYPYFLTEESYTYCCTLSLYVLISYMSKRCQYHKRIKHSLFTSLVLSTLGYMGRATTSSVRYLLQCWVTRETALQENDRVDMLSLELCPGKNLLWRTVVRRPPQKWQPHSKCTNDTLKMSTLD